MDADLKAAESWCQYLDDKDPTGHAAKNIRALLAELVTLRSLVVMIGMCGHGHDGKHAEAWALRSICSFDGEAGFMLLKQELTSKLMELAANLQCPSPRVVKVLESEPVSVISCSNCNELSKRVAVLEEECRLSRVVAPSVTLDECSVTMGVSFAMNKDTIALRSARRATDENAASTEKHQ